MRWVNRRHRLYRSDRIDGGYGYHRVYRKRGRNRTHRLNGGSRMHGSCRTDRLHRMHKCER